MILPTIDLSTIHVHCGDAKVSTGIRRGANLAPAIFWAVNLISGHPALIICYALSDELAEIFVVLGARAIFEIQSLFEISARSSVYERC